MTLWVSTEKVRIGPVDPLIMAMLDSRGICVSDRVFRRNAISHLA
jgi:hypothetical protein